MAGNAAKHFHDILGLAPHNHAAQAIRIATAAARKGAAGNDAVFNLQIDCLGTGAVRDIVHPVVILSYFGIRPSLGQAKRKQIRVFDTPALDSCLSNHRLGINAYPDIIKA